MIGILVLLLIGVFLWITNKSLRWRFGTGIVLGVVMLFSGNRLLPDGDGQCLGVMLIVGCTAWLLYMRGMK